MSDPFDSISVGPLGLPNRIAMAPIKTAYGTGKGRVTDQLVAYFRRRAEGGVGLIISEPFYVDKRGQEHPKQLGIDADDKLDGIVHLVDAVHEGGSRVFAHLNHGGRAANPKAAGGPPEAPSKVPCARTGFEPEVLTEERIAEIVHRFAEAARRSKRAGFDGVELQFGLGYLVSQFLSPATNLRTDSYGGDRQRRMRFAREVFIAVRGAVGDDFPVGVRISGSEMAPEGLEIADAKELARRLESWGADLLHVATGSNCDSLPWYFQHMALPPAVNEGLAGEIRKGVNVPVMAAGRLGDPSRIREVLEAGTVDMVAVGRGLLADPDLPKKMLEGRDDEVMRCGHCLQGCFANVNSGMGIGCNINPEVGSELDEVAPAAQPRRVVVLGGGPAGMQAAVTASGRGHQVTLFERSDWLGGQFALAFLPPGKQRIEEPLRSLVAKVERSGVEIRLGEEATTEKVKALNPDAVIVATGSRPLIPDIEGLDEPMTGEEVLSEKRQTGETVLILGGGMIAMETAEFLARQGKRCVVLVRKGPEAVARDMNPISRKMLMKRLESLPVDVRTETRLARTVGKRAFVTYRDEETELGEFDSVVVAFGNTPVDTLSEDLSEQGFAVQVVGDSERPAQVYDAVHSGHEAGMTI